MVPVSAVSDSAMDLDERAHGLTGESIVISGMSGHFPQSDSVKKLSSILYNKFNPVTSDNSRWSSNHPEISQYIGKAPNLDQFDSQFFMVNNPTSEFMDPMARLLLEHSYQAIYDAGLNPKHLSGKKVGIYTGTSFADKENSTLIDTRSKQGYGLYGCNKSMFANRISYWLNTKGPSTSIDSSCCSFTVALEEACSAINSGRCEAAIVGAANLCVVPHLQFHYNRCIKISPDEKTKSFDEEANGCTISDAVSIIILQKAKDALRAYAEIIYVKNEFISKLSGDSGQVFGFVRNPDQTKDFLNKFYDVAKINPKEVDYLEACGTATPEADKIELETIESIFCGNRTYPLLVGSVVSNIGFTDAASGAAAMTKVLLGFHHGKIAGNLHCTKPRQDIAAIRDGQMRILTDHHPIRMTYAAVNGLSITGMNSHVLLRGCNNPKDTSQYFTSIPRLVTLSARQEDHLKNVFDYLKSRPIDAEELALLHNIHSLDISGHLGRGYIILDSDQQETICLSEKKERFHEVHRPLWFVYSGMGSQWAGMGSKLMRLPIFAAAIERCRKTLEPKGIDIVHIITTPDKTIFDNVLNAFVGIAAIQIGLTDILTALGISPDNIIGHSVGELGCAYADGCLTAEEMILSAYCRGKASNETELIRGSMAAVGLGFKQLSKLCPPSIDIACHNSSSSSTVSGPEDDIREFVAQLTANGVFAKEVPSANIAYHSRYIADAAPTLLHSLREVIESPRARSSRWLSTSVPQEQWSEAKAEVCSAEYLTNNLLNPVFFEEISNQIPSNAVVVEIAPHGLLQAILRRSLPDTCRNIPLTQRGHKDNTLFFLEAIGLLYTEGFNPQLQAIYPKVNFPVSTGTPHLSHLVKWNHTESFSISEYYRISVKSTASSKFSINCHDTNHSYLKGHVVQGKLLYPFAGALVAVWDTLAMTLGCMKKKISVTFSDVHLYTQPILQEQKGLIFTVYLHRGTGRFEVLEGDSKIISGYVVIVNKSHQRELINLNEKYVYNSYDIYQHLTSRSYSFRDDFQSIHSADESFSAAQILWNDNWVTLIEGLIQLNIIKNSSEGVLQLTQFRELTIDLEEHERNIQQSPISGVIKANVDKVLDCTSCGGINFCNLKFRTLLPMSSTVFKLVSATKPSNDGKTVQSMSLNNETKNNVILQIGSVGKLESLYWTQAPRLPEYGIPVLVEYAAINTVDTTRAIGITPFKDTEEFYGMDFSGTTKSGVHVMGLVKNGAARSVVSASPELLWPVPAHWTMEEAATVPLAYIQAFYCLNIKYNLESGSRVLIQGAVGALGQAMISVALARNCQVFATVANNAKKRFLLKLFPELNEDAIGCSRDTSFVSMVLQATNMEGCDLVLINCRRADIKNASTNCVASYGVAIDTSQILNRDEYYYGMYNLRKCKSYMTIDFNNIFENLTELNMLKTLLSDGIALGFVRPLSHVVFEAHEASRAFHLLAASRHRGCVLLRVRNAPELPLAQHRIVCSATNSHLIICDSSSLGLQLADKLIARGAKNIHIHCLHSKSINILKIWLWRKARSDVDISCGPLDSDKSVLSILGETNARGPIEGIYVVSTTATSDSDHHYGVKNVIACLDAASRACSLLKFFGVITVDNNIGKQLCLSRSKHGLPVTLLNIPASTQDISHDDESSWDRAIADVFEQAIQSKNPVLVAESQTAEKLSLVKLLALTDDYDENSKFEDNIALIEKTPIIKKLLSDVFHVTLEDEAIMKLTKTKMLEIEKGQIKEFKELNGLHRWFSYVEPDELQFSTQCLPLSTLLTSVDKFENVIDLKKSILFIIPGLEGHCGRFTTLCENLKISAIALQPGLDHPYETPQELARRYSKILLENFKLQRNFYLLSYECGVSVALELAFILEGHGLTGTVYCLGAGPEEIKALLEAELSSFSNEEELQVGVAQHMYSLMAPCSVAPDERALLGCGSWRSRVDACVRALLGRVSHSAQYARALLEAAYARIHAQRRYKAERYSALRSQLVLMRPRDVPRATRPSELQRYSQLPLRVHDLAAPLALAAADLQVPAIINSYLDDQDLEFFEQRNMCVNYIFK